MGNISINSGNIENAISQLVNKIQTEIIDASTASGNKITNAIENSSGEFIGSIREEVSCEVLALNSVGGLLIEMANFIQSAANAFTHVDTVYNSSKIDN